MLVPRIRELTIKDPVDFVPMLQEIMASCGVAIVFLPHIKGTFLHGATFFDGPNKIVMGLTVRGKDADKFWFSLFHEIYHILDRHIDGINEKLTADEKDRRADLYARNTLVPQEEYDKFIDEYSLNEATIRMFSERIGVHPGIVVGRLQTDKKIEFSWFRSLKEQYKIE